MHARLRIVQTTDVVELFRRLHQMPPHVRPQVGARRRAPHASSHPIGVSGKSISETDPRSHRENPHYDDRRTIAGKNAARTLYRVGRTKSRRVLTCMEAAAKRRPRCRLAETHRDRCTSALTAAFDTPSSREWRHLPLGSPIAVVVIKYDVIKCNPLPYRLQRMRCASKVRCCCQTLRTEVIHSDRHAVVMSMIGKFHIEPLSLSKRPVSRQLNIVNEERRSYLKQRNETSPLFVYDTVACN